MFVPQSQVWVEDQDQKHKLMEEYKSNLRYAHNHQPVYPSSQALSFPPTVNSTALHVLEIKITVNHTFLSTAKNTASILIWAMERVHSEVAASTDTVRTHSYLKLFDIILSCI